jgi:IS30 family transposase
VYTGNEAQAASVQRRLEGKSSPKPDDHELMGEIMRLFKQDLSADQISDRLGVVYPEQPEKQASPSTVYAYLYREAAKAPELKEHFRQNRASGRGHKTVGGR